MKPSLNRPLVTALSLTIAAAALASALTGCGNTPTPPRIQVAVARVQPEGTNVTSLELAYVQFGPLLNCSTQSLKFSVQGGGAYRTVSIIPSVFTKLCPVATAPEVPAEQIDAILLDPAGRIAGFWSSAVAESAVGSFVVGSSDVSPDAYNIARRIDCTRGQIDLQPQVENGEPEAAIAHYSIRSALCREFKTASDADSEHRIVPILRQNLIVGFVPASDDANASVRVTADLF